MLEPKSRRINATGAHKRKNLEDTDTAKREAIARSRESFTKVVQFTPSIAIDVSGLEKLTEVILRIMLPTQSERTEEWVAARRFAGFALGGAASIQKFTIPNIVLPPVKANWKDEPYPLRLEWSFVRRKNETDRHAWLKLIAHKWLSSIGAAEPEYEFNYGPCYGDVYADDLKMVVECGNSSPYRLGAIFSDDLRLVALPYQDDLLTRPELEAYLFMASPHCSFPAPQSTPLEQTA